MRLLALPVALAFLAGCAMTPNEAYEKAAGAQDWELCYFNATGRGPEVLKQQVQAHLINRKVDCNRHAAMMQARAAADGARIDRSLQLIQLGASIAAPPPAATQTTCTSSYVGGSVQTICR